MDRRFSARHPFWNADRGGKGGGAKRYDPHSRKYVDWELDQNWEQHPMRLLPYYTRKEHEWRARHPGRRLEGKDYAHGVPKVSSLCCFLSIYSLSLSYANISQRHNAEYQPFWHRARRIADNQMAGYMEETDNIGADQYNMAFTDRVRGTPGMGRCHTVGVASRGRPDFYLGGPGQRRKLAPIWAQYDARTDNRARWGVPDESWEEEDDNMEMAYVDGMRRDRDRWGPSDQRYIW